MLVLKLTKFSQQTTGKPRRWQVTSFGVGTDSKLWDFYVVGIERMLEMYLLLFLEFEMSGLYSMCWEARGM